MMHCGAMLKKHGSGVLSLPTSLDLYRELQAVTPDSYQSLANRFTYNCIASAPANSASL